ncbi:hypothetical protein CEXT_169831 [Caerostris extrusa]|uniref:Secreted protein n=1 Tax=Caerostris extrusa TaxID=172846 RepID=A0AAV4UNA9_CAEEX|nr:hypothetical protein CEXT_169831 [Caerostris extrusa]
MREGRGVVLLFFGITNAADRRWWRPLNQLGEESYVGMHCKTCFHGDALGDVSSAVTQIRVVCPIVPVRGLWALLLKE